MLEASKNTRIHMQILFNVLMGLRRSEINRLKYSDVDYVNHTLTVRRQLGKELDGKKEDYAPKTITKQEIGLNKTLAAQLYGEFKEFFPENAVEYFVSYYET